MAGMIGVPTSKATSCPTRRQLLLATPAAPRDRVPAHMKNTLRASALLCALTATSCVGPNNDYNGISAWNSRLASSKWVNELVFVGLWVIPVYEVTLALDLLVFNSLEFWGAENPIGTP